MIIFLQAFDNVLQSFEHVCKLFAFFAKCCTCLTKNSKFFEKIADKDTTKDEMIENLKNVLIAHGWTYKDDK